MHTARKPMLRIAVALLAAGLGRTLCWAEDICEAGRAKHCINDDGQPDGNYTARSGPECSKWFHDLKVQGKKEMDCKKATPSRGSSAGVASPHNPTPMKAKTERGTATGVGDRGAALPGGPLVETLVNAVVANGGQREPPKKQDGDKRTTTVVTPPGETKDEADSDTQVPQEQSRPAAPERVKDGEDGETPLEPVATPRAANAPLGAPPGPAGPKHICYAYDRATANDIHVGLQKGGAEPSVATYFKDVDLSYNCNIVKPTRRESAKEWDRNCDVGGLQKGMQGYCAERRRLRTGQEPQPKAGTALASQRALMKAIKTVIEKQLAPEPGVMSEQFPDLNKTIIEGYQRFKTEFADDIRGADHPGNKNDILAIARALDIQMDSYLTEWAWKGPWAGAVARRCASWQPTDETKQACMERLVKKCQETVRNQQDNQEIPGMDTGGKRVQKGINPAVILGAAALGGAAGGFIGAKAAGKNDACTESRESYSACKEKGKDHATCCEGIVRARCRSKLKCPKE